LDPAEYDYLFELEDSLWWFVGMRRIVGNLLTEHVKQNGDGTLKVLDAGCGTGGQLRQLEGWGQVTAFDFYPRAAAMSSSRRPGRVAVASIDAIPFQDASFDLVTALDVVCQLPMPQDDAALRELARVLKPGGTLVVRVPALQMLYGSHDRTLHTFHRYTTGEMVEKMRKAGLRPVRSTYANTLLFPVALVRRLLSRLTSKPPTESDVRGVPGPLNLALKAVLYIESEILKRTSLPVGLSVIALARKPE
jgi:SAM-dependent methyltransferase